MIVDFQTCDDVKAVLNLGTLNLNLRNSRFERCSTLSLPIGERICQLSQEAVQTR